ncbi:uncharacterized protein BDR25DRAFT_353050 [Lindgomyces ingoldianus]|uniref:Uncharacterized protein n=1 Tax=Lindgomyces ingoldianus TaxID=673940 RepID=A0ACB6R0Q6_9PLEO|nr:uncharacterized protein BDR25DRAFT_353050 [Lindgomyces ingoldianus]KAF2472721.1 hypothetical protein BDR25DRAFT_353050 [Lindgomyces ingoldianus]
MRKYCSATLTRCHRPGRMLGKSKLAIFEGYPTRRPVPINLRATDSSPVTYRQVKAQLTDRTFDGFPAFLLRIYLKISIFAILSLEGTQTDLDFDSKRIRDLLGGLVDSLYNPRTLVGWMLIRRLHKHHHITNNLVAVLMVPPITPGHFAFLSLHLPAPPLEHPSTSANPFRLHRKRTILFFIAGVFSWATVNVIFIQGHGMAALQSSLSRAFLFNSTALVLALTSLVLFERQATSTKICRACLATSPCSMPNFRIILQPEYATASNLSFHPLYMDNRSFHSFLFNLKMIPTSSPPLIQSQLPRPLSAAKSSNGSYGRILRSWQLRDDRNRTWLLLSSHGLPSQWVTNAGPVVLTIISPMQLADLDSPCPLIRRGSKYNGLLKPDYIQAFRTFSGLRYMDVQLEAMYNLWRLEAQLQHESEIDPRRRGIIPDKQPRAKKSDLLASGYVEPFSASVLRKGLPIHYSHVLRGAAIPMIGQTATAVNFIVFYSSDVFRDLNEVWISKRHLGLVVVCVILRRFRISTDSTYLEPLFLFLNFMFVRPTALPIFVEMAHIFDTCTFVQMGHLRNGAKTMTQNRT